MHSRPRPSGSSASIATVPGTSSRRAGRMVTGATRMAFSAGLSRRAQAQRLFGRADPASDRAIAVEMKTTFVRDPCIGQQRYVGERERIPDQEWRFGQLMLHSRQRGIAALQLVGIEIG